MALARGWVDDLSMEAAAFSSSGVRFVSTTFGAPSVRVPVLSRIAAPSSRAVCTASALRISSPRFEAAPVPATSAMGMASPSAQGQAITSVEMKAFSAFAGLAVPRKARGRGDVPYIRYRTHQNAPDSTASRNTTGTKRFVTRSAKAWMGIFAPWASRINEAMRERKLSSPTDVARTRRAPVRFREPPVTASPTPRDTGMDSPVSMDSSIDVVPRTISPSTAMRSPGRTTTTFPDFTASIGTSTVLPPSSFLPPSFPTSPFPISSSESSSRAVGTERDRSARTCFDARSRSRDSM